MKRQTLFAAAGLMSVVACLPLASHATNGYFSHGYGTKSKGLAGGGVALPQDAMIAATNPAGLAFVGTRLDLGAAVFSPRRGYHRTGTGLVPANGPGDGSVESSKEWFLIPHFAASYMLDDVSAVGVAVYGNGGMNTTYRGKNVIGDRGTFAFSGSPTTGVDLIQLFVNTTYSRRITDNLAVGASVILAAQRFEAFGIDAGLFGGFVADGTPDSLTNKGFDYSYGAGGKVGLQLDLHPRLSFGASYQSRIYMSEFEEYEDLFAEQGDFDIPPTATLGLAFKPTNRTTITFDVQRTWYSDIDSVGNPMQNLNDFGLDPEFGLGGDRGAGFGWDDMTIYKLGFQWEAGGGWTWRLGYSDAEQPIPEEAVLFNVLAPAVMEEHYTIGFTKEIGKRSELSFAAFYAPEVKVRGGAGTEPFLSGFTAPDSTEIHMTQYEVELSWGWKF